MRSAWAPPLLALLLCAVAASWSVPRPAAAPEDPSLKVVAEDPRTRTIRHLGGVDVLPKAPARIAVLGWVDEACALGVVPVAAGGDGRNGFPPHLQAYLPGTAVVDAGAGRPRLEALAATRPDVIVAVALLAPHYERLRRIAPTVLIPAAQADWRERFRDVALVLDRVEKGERVLAALEARIAAARDAIRARIGGETVAMLRIFAREFRLYGKSYSGPLLYRDLELAAPEAVRKMTWKGDVARLSLEGVARLDADHLLVMIEEDIPVSAQVQGRLEAHPLWRNLKAVRAGHVHPVPERLMRGGVLSRGEMVDLLRGLLAP